MTQVVLETPSVEAALRWAGARLRAAGVEQARRDARLLLAALLESGIEGIMARPERPLSPRQNEAFAILIERRSRREPVSRILGRREFWGLALRIGPTTLDPRPDSETVIEALLPCLPRDRPIAVLDLGTGSGCLLLALLRERPLAWGLGLDCDYEAVALARQNARAHGLADRACFAVGDWAEPVGGSWQAIVSNPPYIKMAEIDTLEPEVAQYEPRRALDGGGDGLAAYRVLAPQIRRLLASDGVAALEIGVDQAANVTSLLADAGLNPSGLKCDLSGRVRCLLARHKS